MADDHFLEGILNEESTPIWSQQASEFVSQPLEQTFPIGEESPTLRVSKRSKIFSKDEDNMLVSAYLGISLDPVQGNDQSGRTYWNRMHHYFHKHRKFDSDRGEKSLSNCLQVIMKDTSLFKGYYEKIQLRNQSGASESDKISEALVMFNSEEKRPFSFFHCWNTLKHQQKWIDRPSTVTKRREKVAPKLSQNVARGCAPEFNSSDYQDVAGDSTPDQEPMPMPRPPGRKGEKERQRRGKSSNPQDDNHYMDAMDLLLTKRKEADEFKEAKKKERHDEKLKLELAKMEDDKAYRTITQMDIEDRIMARDTRDKSETQRLYYERMQKKITAKCLGADLG